VTTSGKTGLVFDGRYLDHDTGLAFMSAPVSVDSVWEPQPHVASPALVARVDRLLMRTGLKAELADIPARTADVEEIAAVHTREYISRIRHFCDAGGGEAGEYAPASPETYDIALLSAGGALAAVDKVVAGDVRNAYALIRPPGHHAMPDKAMGFCIFNNVAVAAKYARSRLGLGRVAIVDWDVHHGNGTQTAFYEDPDVLFVSLHQEEWYPEGFGSPEQTGANAGVGYTVNIPLPPGTGNAGYSSAFQRIVVPVLRAFRPDLILISAGQDASAVDPIGRMMISTAGYRRMTQDAVGVADEVCGGRLVALHEGGYNETYAPACTWAIIEELSGIHSGIEDPYASWLEPLDAATKVGPAEAFIDAVVAVHRDRWSLE
jgi:acetoin utilization deacetylase AcuC-like enzyme